MHPTLNPSAWRKFPVPRVVRRPVERPRKSPQLSMFYGLGVLTGSDQKVTVFGGQRFDFAAKSAACGFSKLHRHSLFADPGKSMRRAIKAYRLVETSKHPQELCLLSVKDIYERRGVKHLRIYGKGEKLRYVPLHPGSLDRINEYLDTAGHGALPSAPAFKPIRNNRQGTTDSALTADGVYQVLKFYGRKAGISVDRFGPRSARATAATNALDHGADVAKVQEWGGTRERQHNARVRPSQDEAGR